MYALISASCPCDLVVNGKMIPLPAGQKARVGVADLPSFHGSDALTVEVFEDSGDRIAGPGTPSEVVALLGKLRAEPPAAPADEVIS